VRVLASSSSTRSATLQRSNAPLSKKLKVLSIVLNIVTRHLMVAAPDETARFVHRALAQAPSTPVRPPDAAANGTESPLLVPLPKMLALPASGIFEAELIEHIQSSSEVGRPPTTGRRGCRLQRR